ncbi:hypothetical protein UlMin_040353 [Ulmus minor]
MGNCQAIDAAALVIQHPCGKIERYYWSISASEVMRMNPGHYVSLIIPLPGTNEENNNQEEKTVRFTRVKLLRPSETLTLGHAYRLVTTQEVMRVLRAKKYAKAKKQQLESVEISETDLENIESTGCEAEGRTEKKTSQASKQERQRQRTPSANAMAMKSKSWRPSLQSISESAS